MSIMSHSAGRVLGLGFYMVSMACSDLVAEIPAADQLELAAKVYDRLLSQADSRFRPGIYGPPVLVTCDFFIQSLGPLEETDMIYHLDVYVRQWWHNPRLDFTDLHDVFMVIPDKHIDNFWLPDTFFPNLRSGEIHKVTLKNRLLRIYPNGTTLYALRMALQLYCDMDLRFFPFDFQDCPLKISSYAYTTRELNLTWNNDSPIDNSGTVIMPQFSLKKITYSGCDEVYSTGRYPCLQVVFHVERESGFYILQIYISSWLIVSVSWLSFFLSRDAVPARTALTVTTVLSMATLLISANNGVVRVSYARAIDVWFTVCMTMVFLALLEYVAVNTIERWLKRSKRKGYYGGKLTPASVDFVSRIVYPFVFIVANIVYWAYYRQPHAIFGHGQPMVASSEEAPIVNKS